MRPDAQAHQLPLSEQPTVLSRTLHPGQPDVGSDGIDQSCLVPVRLLQDNLLQRHRRVRKVRHVELSLARIGSYYWLKMTKQLKLTARFVREHLPPPRLRMFKWLMAPQK